MLSRRVVISIVGLALLLGAVVALRLVIGTAIGVGGAGGDGGSRWGFPMDAEGWGLRGQRVVVGVVVGVCLAVGGVMLQSLLRNPLASPEILGLASGASLAVIAAIYVGMLVGSGGVSYGSAAWHAGPALIGSIGAMGLVYLLSQRRGLVDPVSLVLVGVVVGIICSAGVMFVQQLMPDRGLAAGRLLIGALSDEAGWREIAAGGTVALAGLVIGVWAGPAMDAAAVGDDEAHSLGVRLGALRQVLFVTAGALTAVAVVLAGPVGFVGLVCPHAVRLMTGMRGGHRWLVVGAALAGGALVVGADAAVRGLDLASGRLPIGVLTALIGGPAFIVLLRRERLAG